MWNYQIKNDTQKLYLETANHYLKQFLAKSQL